MQTRLFRLWAWLAVSFLVVTSSLPAGLAHAEISEVSAPPLTEESEPTTATHATVVLNELRPAATGSNQEFIELFHTSPTTTIDISGWKLMAGNTTISTFTSSTTIAPQSWRSVTFTGVLSDTDETISLANASGSVVDQIHYGLSKTAQIGAPNPNLSIGRRADGADTWYSQLAATAGAANGSALTLTAPSNPLVKAGTGNAAHTINLANKAGVVVETTLPASSLGNDQIVFDLVDTTNALKFVTATALAGGGRLASGPIDTTAATALVDGTITVRAFAKAASGIETAYALGTTATRDTVAPEAATALAVAATSGNNAASIINLASRMSIKTTVTLPASTTAADTIRVDLSDGPTVVSQSSSLVAGGGTFVLQDRLGLPGMNGTALADGPVALRATITDAAGNSSATFTGTQATKDTALPTGRIEINSGTTVTTSSSVSLTLSASDVGTGAAEMRLANTNDFTGANFEPFTNNKAWSLLAGEGPRTVYLQLKDGAGNLALATNHLAHAETLIFVRTDAMEIVKTSVPTGTETLRQGQTEVTLSATSPTAVTTATYRSNPGPALPAGNTSVTSFFEIGIADASRITFPATIKRYYSNADLSAAGVTDERQLLGLAFDDLASQTWQTYRTTGVVTTDTSVDGQAMAGYVFATADHFTPMVILADTTPPGVPTGLKATERDRAVELAWDRVPEAASYLIRYRRMQATATSTTVVVGNEIQSLTVTNLVNGASYEFGVAAHDASGNTSDFASLSASPRSAERPTSGQSSALRVLAPRAGAAPPATLTPPPAPTIQPDLGPPREPTTPADDRIRDLNRLLMILAIVIIAIGAGLSGFYGYQWWVTRPLGPEIPPPAQPSPLPPVTPLTPPSASAPVEPPAPNQPPEPPKPPEPPPPTGRW